MLIDLHSQFERAGVQNFRVDKVFSPSSKVELLQDDEDAVMQVSTQQ